MNLCIDQGNSRTKVALMTDEGKIINHFIYKSFSSSDVERLFDLYEITDSIISSVINIEAAVVNTLSRRSQHFVLFDHMTPVPIINRYDTPATLGQDRLAAAVGAKSLCPDENLLIIDAGSAITYDFIPSRVPEAATATIAAAHDQETAAGGSGRERTHSAVRQEHTRCDRCRCDSRGGIRSERIHADAQRENTALSDFYHRWKRTLRPQQRAYIAHRDQNTAI